MRVSLALLVKACAFHFLQQDHPGNHENSTFGQKTKTTARVDGFIFQPNLRDCYVCTYHQPLLMEVLLEKRKKL